MRRAFLIAGMSFILALLAMPVQAQELTAEQLEVWEVISKQWEMEKAGDMSWVHELHPSFQGWPVEAPMPFSKSDAERFFAADAGLEKILVYDIAPVAIIVTEHTAVAHYYYTVVSEHEDGESDLSTGRSTDVLVRTADGWKHLSWVGEEKLTDGH